MISWFFRLFKGQHYRKFLKKVNPLVQKINLLEEEYQQLSEDALRAKTAEFKERYQNGETLEQLLPEAFAVVKNAARRMVGQKIVVCDHELTWDMVPFDVQLIGGMSLHWGRIAEMATGEGKTLVATLPLYLNALSGRNCQLVTVNDYLVRRDAEWNGYLYRYLGLTVGYIQNQMESAERRAAYAADITYGTASEFGFDYLRDNGMATRQQDQVQRDHFFCIVDEVDSILVDEARTPLIISGPVQVEREAPFPVFKPAIERLVSLQNRLCTRLATEAKEVLDASVDGDAAEEAIKKLLQVRMGMPKNRVLMRLMEQGPVRKKLDRLEVEMNGDFRRDELYHLKEELYFTIEEKHHQSDLTELGRQTLSPNDPDGFMLPDLSTLFMELDRRLDLSADERQRLKLQGEDRFQQVAENIHCIGQLLRAYCLYERDVEYVVQDGKVVIVDENTGRIMPGRRWSDGLHQAVEAKEGTAIQEESKTYATITIQNYFRLYDKLAGMTGTA
ncbi:MAG: preprotein translocase subunit SecA, partial [Verrucomicrobia bacterium 21-51-4]